MICENKRLSAKGRGVQTVGQGCTTVLGDADNIFKGRGGVVASEGGVLGLGDGTPPFYCLLSVGFECFILCVYDLKKLVCFKTRKQPWCLELNMEEREVSLLLPFATRCQPPGQFHCWVCLDTYISASCSPLCSAGGGCGEGWVVGLAPQEPQS